MTFNRLLLNQPLEPNHLRLLAAKYHELCEAYDKTVCSHIDETGIAMPTTSNERILINRNALTMRDRIYREDVLLLDIYYTFAEWQKAISNYRDHK